MATSLYPFFSKREITSPTSCRCTPSGLMACHTKVVAAREPCMHASETDVRPKPTDKNKASPAVLFVPTPTVQICQPKKARGVSFSRLEQPTLNTYVGHALHFRPSHFLRSVPCIREAACELCTCGKQLPTVVCHMKWHHRVYVLVLAYLAQ